MKHANVIRNETRPSPSFLTSLATETLASVYYLGREHAYPLAIGALLAPFAYCALAMLARFA